MKKMTALLLVCLMALALLTGCTAAPAAPTATEAPAVEAPAVEAPAAEAPAEPAVEAPAEPAAEEPAKLAATEIQVFIAASLENAFKEIIPLYNATQPDVTVTYNADSSGTLLTQIQEGAACDVFFSAATKQVKQLNEDGLMIADSRVDLLCNKVALISYKGSGTTVTGFKDIQNAKSFALADGSVPVGKYTRQILVNLGVLAAADDVSAIPTADVAAALGGMEINECGNVSKVKEAVKEGSNEIGTVYYSDAYSVRDDVDVLEIADASLSGDIIYPVCRVVNPEATEAETAAADDFIAFLQTDAVKAIFENYMFIIYG